MEFGQSLRCEDEFAKIRTAQNFSVACQSGIDLIGGPLVKTHRRLQLFEPSLITFCQGGTG